LCDLEALRKKKNRYWWEDDGLINERYLSVYREGMRKFKNQDLTPLILYIGNS